VKKRFGGFFLQRLGQGKSLYLERLENEELCRLIPDWHSGEASSFPTVVLEEQLLFLVSKAELMVKVT